MFDARTVRRDFPILQKPINGKPLIYLDSAATSLKPRPVLDAINDYYTRYTANINRGIYKISEEATERYEQARKKVAAFIHAKDAREIVFTRNATESLNLVYYSWAKEQLSHGDEVVGTIMEHHSNFVPWQQLSKERGVAFRIWNVDKRGLLDSHDLDKYITRKTKLLTFTAVSNVLGTINPIKNIVKKVKRVHPSCIILIDAAQMVPHMPMNVQDWGADVVVFSGHKMLGPTGIGVLWAKLDILGNMPPYQYGGDMIKEVHVHETVFNDVPHKFEAGTPDIAGAIGLGAAVDYLSRLGMEQVRNHEKEMTKYAFNALSSIKGLSIIGPKDEKKRGGVIAFTMKGIHPHDIAQVLDEDNVCIRVGFHCAQPLHEFFNIGPTARASFYIYTTKEDIDSLTSSLTKVKKMFA
ncbi:cysteine desulfurase [Candidatus Gottesmanbacteria bacterium]|nr:cysteine desulfurase [Candidatus Gottesmanbacteria bacterium]